MEGRRRLIAALATSLAAMTLTSGGASQPRAAPTCNAGSGVTEDYCRYFVKFTPMTNPTDPAVAEAMGLSASKRIRSIALVIAISRYPHLGDTLEAAATDGDRLVHFFADDQKFDEVIALRDDQATKASIDNILRFLAHRGAILGGNSRLVIAYSGHGVPDSTADGAAFVLGGAATTSDPDYTYPMTYFGKRIQTLAANFYHVLALVNACYGGHIFGAVQGGGNADGYDERGSYAITAGPSTDTVFSLDAKKGSIFFDEMLTGIARGNADREYNALIDSKGNYYQWGGLTRTLALVNYLTSRFDAMSKLKIHTQSGVLNLRRPWIGAIMPEGQVANGGFFFLSPVVTLPGHAPIALGPGPQSGVDGRPDLKVFKAPIQYPVKGYDFSSANNYIDWKEFGAHYAPRFAYVRVSAWAGLDTSFDDRWTNLRALHVDRGAFLKFDFCSAPAAQLKALAWVEALPTAELPLAIQLVTPTNDVKDPAYNLKQLKCYTDMGREAAKTAIATLASGIQDQFHKVPLLYGNRYNLSQLTDVRDDRFMLWLSAYSPSGHPDEASLRLPGSNPWTIWQYTSALTLAGIGESNEGNVFFGTPTQYELFKAGRSNVALDAIRHSSRS